MVTNDYSIPQNNLHHSRGSIADTYGWNANLHLTNPRTLGRNTAGDLAASYAFEYQMSLTP